MSEHNWRLDRPLIIYDIEGTGVDPAKDYIIDLAAVKLLPDGRRLTLTTRFRPPIPIPAGATEVHGIHDEDVADSPRFADLAVSLQKWFAGCDLGGYNIRNYDMPLLWEEFERAGLRWDLSGVRIVDAEKIFKKREKRDLTSAVRFFCQREHEGAHGALADAEAALDVIEGQRAKYEDVGAMTMSELDAYSTLDEMPRVDLAGKLVRDAEGFAVYNFGKAKGRRVRDDRGFGWWMMRQDWLSRNTRLALTAALEE